MTMSDTDSSRVEALRRARRRRPWTDELLVECAADSAEFKADLPACAACPEPCEADEVCATAVAKAGDLFESMGREQAYHLVENGMKRLRTRDEAELRTADRERPNTFLALDRDADALGGDGADASDADGLDGSDADEVESRDERRTNSPEQR